MNIKDLSPDKRIEFLKKYEIDMYRIAKGILKNEEDCKDALQETMIRAYRNMDKVKEEQYIKTWLLRITINECNRIYKKRKYLSFLPKEKIVKDIEENIDLHNEIVGLSLKYREPLILYYFAACTYEEIGRILKLPVGTVKSRIYYAKNKLKERLGDGNE